MNLYRRKDKLKVQCYLRRLVGGFADTKEMVLSNLSFFNACIYSVIENYHKGIVYPLQFNESLPVYYLWLYSKPILNSCSKNMKPFFRHFGVKPKELSPF